MPERVEITHKVVGVRQQGACNACGYPGMRDDAFEYRIPDATVTEVGTGATGGHGWFTFRFCDKCLREFKRGVEEIPCPSE